VTIDGVPAPLAYVSPTQINAQVPGSLAAPGFTSGLAIAGANVVVTTSAGLTASMQVGLSEGAPGFFSADGSGCLQAAALNTAPDGTVAANSASNTAQAGDYISLFGTGFGPAVDQPPDGSAGGASPLQTTPRVFLDGNAVTPSYAGLAPGLVGVDQINFRVPDTVRNGCSVPLSASQGFGSATVTVSIQRGRGPCTDPQTQSWGQLVLYKNVFSPSSLPAQEGFTASFPSGPNVQAPAPDPVVYAPNFAVGGLTGVSAIFSAVPTTPRICQVPGYSSLSAGAIQVQPPTGGPVTAQPLPLLSGGVIYSQLLPSGFVAPGRYTLTGDPNNQVGLAAGVTVGSPIQIQTPLAPGTAISLSRPFTIGWTGGDPGTLVKLTLTSGSSSVYSYADAGSGSLTINPVCTTVSAPAGSSIVCNFGIPISQAVTINVEVLPALDQVETVSLPGVTGPVKLTWQYSYSFSGLVLTE
jgi:uncharacterized protein (TIGR03437 family)